tara:strand:+ start:112 stop:831 length:720 start_codon:yes stop_codon:yes gene_type:complete
MSTTETQIILGLHSSLAAIINKKRKIKKIVCTEEVYRKNKELFDSFKKIEKKIQNRKKIDLLTGEKFHQGIAVYCENLPKRTISDIGNEENLIIFLDSLNDPQNVGSIIRTAYAFGVETIIYSKHNSFEINPLLIKSASGAFERVKLIEVTNLNKTLNFFKKNNFWIVGLDNNSNTEIQTVPSDLKKVIILGSENKGIKKLLLENCDFRVKIQIKKSKFVDSLNVSNAAAITLFELRKK